MLLTLSVVNRCEIDPVLSRFFDEYTINPKFVHNGREYNHAPRLPRDAMDFAMHCYGCRTNGHGSEECLVILLGSRRTARVLKLHILKPPASTDGRCLPSQSLTEIMPGFRGSSLPDQISMTSDFF